MKWGYTKMIGSRITGKSRIIIIILSVILAGAALFLSIIRADAAQEDYGFRLRGEAVKLRGEDAYDVTIYAYSAKDFSGYVRMSVINNSSDSISYDTKISLPAGTEKSFTLRIPTVGYFNEEFETPLAILDNQKKELYTENAQVFLNVPTEPVRVGVYSSIYDKMSYLSLDGDKLARLNGDVPVETVDLSKANLNEELPALNYIVIDSYDTNLLAASDIAKIERFVSDGGILIIGTGANEGLSIKGFSKNFIDATISGRGVNTQLLNLETADIIYGYSYYYSGFGIDGYYKRVDKGVLYLASVSLGDKGLTENLGAPRYIKDLYDMTYNASSFYYDKNSSGVDYDSMTRFFGYIEGLKNIKIVGLKWLVVGYVLLIGPVLYLILKKFNRREYFWAVIPALTVIAVIVVMIFARRYKLSERNVASVSLASLDGDKIERTYAAAFSTRKGNISFETADDILGVGSIYNYSGRYNGRKNTTYGVTAEGNTLSLSHEGQNAFDKGYFVMQSENDASGSIKVELNKNFSAGRYGTITNYTEYDIDYYLVYMGNNYSIVKGAKPGESSDISKDLIYFGTYYLSGDSSYIPKAFENNDKADSSAVAALLFGMEELEADSNAFVIGLTGRHDRISRGDINELSYGLYYQYIEYQEDKVFDD